MSEAEDNGKPNGATTDASEAEAAPEVVVEATVEDPIAVAKAETAKMRDQLLRTAADFDNFRKRSRKELDDAYARGRETTVKDLLPVFDNLERALTIGGAAEAKAVVDGLRIVLKQFQDTLEKMGITRVPGVGAAFDPAVHEAIQQLESPDHGAGVVMAEVQPGYAMGTRLVRAALVVVSKGPASAS